MMLEEALEILREHQHGYVWIEGKPENTRQAARVLLNAGYLGLGPGAESFEEARGLYMTNRGHHWLKNNPPAYQGPRCKYCKAPIEDDTNGFCKRPDDACWHAWLQKQKTGPTSSR